MNTSFRKHLYAWLMLLLPLAVIGQDYFSQYGQEPLKLTNTSGGRNRTIYLMGIDGNELRFRNKLNDSRQISIPLDSEGIQLIFPVEGDFRQGLFAYREKAMVRAVNLMRADIYPMLRFLAIPSDKINLHEHVTNYLLALNATGNDTVEAYRILDRLPKQVVVANFMAPTLVTIEGLARKGERDKALDLISLIPVGEQFGSVVPILSDLAGELRRNQDFQGALAIYERILQIAPEEERILPTLWVAYCNQELGNDLTTDSFLSAIGSLEHDRTAQSLKLTIEGKQLVEKQDFEQAMHRVSHAIVLADFGFSWAAELNYLSGFCYEKLGEHEVARQIYGEVALIFPDTLWADRSQQRLDALPAADVGNN